MKHYKKIIGKNIYLSPFSDDDYILFTEWVNDYEVAKYIDRYSKIYTLEDEKEFVDRARKDDKVYLSIVRLDNDEMIGNISLMDIDNINKTATLGIMIGAFDGREKGYGTEAIKLLLNYAFNSLNLNNIMLELVDVNERAKKCYLKCGFNELGIRKQSCYFEGEYHDTIFMQILKEDFNSDKGN